MTAADDANVERLQAAIERFNAGDLDAYGTAFHDDCQRWFAGAPGPVGNAAALDAVRELRRAFSEFRLEADRVIPGGGYVVAVWRARGRHTGEYQRVPTTGVDIDVEACEIYEFRSGKVARSWTYGDPLELVRQLGVDIVVGAPSG